MRWHLSCRKSSSLFVSAILVLKYYFKSNTKGRLSFIHNLLISSFECLRVGAMAYSEGDYNDKTHKDKFRDKTKSTFKH